MRLGTAASSALPLLFLAAVAALAGATHEHGWPQWRGIRRTGEAAGPIYRGVPPIELRTLWERTVGAGYSGPIISGDRLWIHSREGDREVVRSLRLTDGSGLWRRWYDAPFRQDDDGLIHGSGPYATPSLAGARLVTFGINSVLSAWNAEKGHLLWRRASAEEFDPAFPYFGNAASPLIWDGLCFVHFGGHARVDIYDAASGAMLALRISDGDEVWRWEGDGPAVGASPIIHSIRGQPQLVFKTKDWLVGLDPRTGEEHWRMRFPVLDDNTIVTPLSFGDLLITSDFDLGVTAWRFERDGDSWRPRELWRQRDVSLSMSSPVPAAGLIVGFSHKRAGELFALDPNTGAVLWRGEPRGGEHATLISAGDQLLLVAAAGRSRLGTVDRTGFHVAGDYRFGPKAGWSHPAIVGNRIAYRTGTSLVVAETVARAGGPALR
jgi:outer membrane protein assembly factor BamB